MDTVHILLRELDELYHILDAKSAFDEFVTADAHIDVNPSADSVTHGFHYLQGKRMRFSKLPPYQSVR